MFDGIFQPTHLILILAICLLFFGPKKLPELSRGLAESIREFKKTMAEGKDKPTEPVQATASPVVEDKK